MSDKNQFYRFRAFVSDDESKPNSGEKRNVGMAYVRDGHELWTLKLWMFPENRFYLLPDRKAASQMLIFTRELRKDLSSNGGKYFWNCVGRAYTLANVEVIRLEFDLFSRPLFIGIFPEHGNMSDVTELSEFKKSS